MKSVTVEFLNTDFVLSQAGDKEAGDSVFIPCPGAMLCRVFWRPGEASAGEVEGVTDEQISLERGGRHYRSGSADRKSVV